MKLATRQQNDKKDVLNVFWFQVHNWEESAGELDIKMNDEIIENPFKIQIFFGKNFLDASAKIESGLDEVSLIKW